MIAKFRAVVGPSLAGALQRHVVLIVAYGVAQGVAFLLLVPTLTALLAGDTDAAWGWLAVLAGAVAVSAVLYYVQAMAGYDLGLALSRTVHRRIGDQVASLPLGWFEGRRVGDLSRLASTGVQDVMGIAAHVLKPIVVAIVTPLTVLVGMAFLDWRLALSAVLMLPLLMLTYWWTARLGRRTDHAVHEAGADAAGRVVEFARTQPVLRAFAGERGRALLDDTLVRQQQAGRRMMLTVVQGLVLFALVVQAAVVVVLIVGVTLALGGSVSAPELLALLVLAVRFVEPLIAVADLGTAIQMARNALDRIDALLTTPTLPEPAESDPVVDASVDLDHVEFSYTPGTPVIRDVSLRLAPGTMTAIVGPSGSGKTTLTRLVARFFDVDAGTVRVGGADVRDLRTADLMAQLSLVFQDVYLFTGSILENIRLGRPAATDEEVVAAGRVARVDEIVERLPDGWHSEVGEGGARLSGGERQRLSIARALLKDTPIVLLDEATAALDPINEAAVQDGLRALTVNRTVLVIAHRLQTVVAADRIVVLDEGQIVEDGTHDELLQAGGRYAAFWEARSRAAGWRLAASAPAAV